MWKLFSLGLILVSMSVGCWGTIIITMDDKSTVEWAGCLYKKLAIFPWENTTCSSCATNGVIPAKFDQLISLPQEYINCTKDCALPTICTKYKYNIDGVLRAECYQCEHPETEILRYHALRSYKICSDECKSCAKEADLSTASYCSYKCNGKPTFCYPMEKIFRHYKCYQSYVMYGCTFKRVPNSALSLTCMECALEAKDVIEGHLCASVCEGIITYHEINESGKNVALQCQIGNYHEVFEPTISAEILKFLKVETPLSLAKSIYFQKYVPKYTPPNANHSKI